jgi:serine/threonine protein kinase
MSKGPQWWVKIADFGISKRAVEGLTALRTLVGTPAFAAPEVLGYGCGSMNDRHGDPYTHAVDIWSTGVIMFLILTGEIDLQSLQRYGLGSINFPLKPLHARSISESGCDLTQALMARKPQQRPTAKQSLQHTWLTQLDGNETHVPTRYFSQAYCNHLR